MVDSVASVEHSQRWSCRSCRYAVVARVLGRASGLEYLTPSPQLRRPEETNACPVVLPHNGSRLGWCPLTPLSGSFAPNLVSLPLGSAAMRGSSGSKLTDHSSSPRRLRIMHGLQPTRSRRPEKSTRLLVCVPGASIPTGRFQLHQMCMHLVSRWPMSTLEMRECGDEDKGLGGTIAVLNN